MNEPELLHLCERFLHIAAQVAYIEQANRTHSLCTDFLSFLRYATIADPYTGLTQELNMLQNFSKFYLQVLPPLAHIVIQSPVDGEQVLIPRLSVFFKVISHIELLYHTGVEICHLSIATRLPQRSVLLQYLRNDNDEMCEYAIPLLIGGKPHAASVDCR